MSGLLLQILLFLILVSQVEFLVVERRGLECYTCGGPSQMCSDHHQETPVQCYPNVTTCSVGRIKHKITREVNIVVMIS